MNRFLRLLIVLPCLFGACKPPQPSDSSSSGQLTVVATHTILADAVKNIGRDRINLITLVGPNGDPHTYEPSPGDVKNVAEARIYFENGFGLESWSDKLYRSSESKAMRVTATQGLTPRKMEEGEPKDEPASSGHEETDPHVWNDVQNFIRMSENVRDAFIAADPAHTASYRANAETYLKELQDLDAWVIQEVGLLPMEKRKLVTNHDVFGYFARRYQFEVLGDALGSLSTEANDPSAAHVAKLVEDIKKTGVKTIFGDFSSNPKLIAQIAKEAGVQIGPELFVDSLGAPGSGGETYEKMIRHNVSSIVEGLK